MGVGHIGGIGVFPGGSKSGGQILQYLTALPFHRNDRHCRLALRFAAAGDALPLVDRQMECILYDPYANAFNDDGRSFFCMDRTDMKPYLWERKYELDSLCFPVQLSYLIWKNTGCSRQHGCQN